MYIKDNEESNNKSLTNWPQTESDKIERDQRLYHQLLFLLLLLLFYRSIGIYSGLWLWCSQLTNRPPIKLVNENESPKFTFSKRVSIR